MTTTNSFAETTEKPLGFAKFGPPTPLETETPDELVRPSEAGWVSFADDPWTTSKDLEAKHRSDVAYELYEFTTTSGEGWFGALTPSGFGPTALVPFRSSEKTEKLVQDDSVVTDIDSVDVSTLRVEAGFRPTNSVGWKASVRGQYSDYLSSAGIFPIIEDDDEASLWDDGVWNDEVFEEHLASEGTSEEEQLRWEATLQAEGLAVL